MRTLSLAFLALFAAPLALADLIDPQTSAPIIVIPVAGDAAGANGTYFRSDITVVNLRDVSQAVEFRWLPEGGGPGAVVSMTIGPRSGIVSEDFVQNILHQSGIGAIQIIGMNDAGADGNARLHASARIWTPAPDGTGGTMSQTFPAMVLSNAQLTNIKWILGVRRDERYRMNVGVANPSSLPIHVRVTIVGTAGPSEQIELDLPAGSMQQINLPGTAPVTQVILQKSVTTPDVIWYGWASSVDNITGDAWSQSAFPAPAQ